MALAAGAPPAVIVDEQAVVREEPPPHGNIGMSTAFRISDAVPQPKSMEFRRRDLHVGAAIGSHPVDHDEVYYVLSGEGEVVADGVSAPISKGKAAYLYKGSVVGVRQMGSEPLSLIIAYPVLPK